MADHCLHARKCFVSLDLFRSTQTAQFYLFMWLFWRTPSTLKIAKSSPPMSKFGGVEVNKQTEMQSQEVNCMGFFIHSLHICLDKNIKAPKSIE